MASSQSENDFGRDPEVSTEHDSEPHGTPHASTDADPNNSEGSDTEASGADQASGDAGETEQLRDQLVRTQAELDNFRKRARRELEDERRYASLPLIRDLVAVLDNLQRAIDAASQPATNEAQSQQQTTETPASERGVLEGVKMVAQHLRSILEQHNCQEIEAIGQPFDPNLHEAVGQAPSAEFESGNVMHVTLTGYKLHERVVRPSHVLISSGPPPQQDEAG